MQVADAPLSVAGESGQPADTGRRQPGPLTPATGQKGTRDVEADGHRGQPVRPEVGLATWARACELTRPPSPGPSVVWVTVECISVPRSR